MQNFKFYIIVLFIFFGINIYPQSIKERVADAMRLEFGQDVSYSTSKIIVPKIAKREIEKKVKQRFYSDYVYKIIVNRSDSSLVLGLLDNVYGKSMPITFLVLFDEYGNIMSTNVLKYREPYGGGVKLKSWNEQFKGKNNKSEFTVGDDIESISGATISVRSLTKGIKKLTLLFEKIKNKK